MKRLCPTLGYCPGTIPGGTEQNHSNFRAECRPLSRDLIHAVAKQEAEVLPTF
jgi:hypothetical protein